MEEVEVTLIDEKGQVDESTILSEKQKKDMNSQLDEVMKQKDDLIKSVSGSNASVVDASIQKLDGWEDLPVFECFFKTVEPVIRFTKVYEGKKTDQLWPSKQDIDAMKMLKEMKKL